MVKNQIRQKYKMLIHFLEESRLNKKAQNIASKWMDKYILLNICLCTYILIYRYAYKIYKVHFLYKVHMLSDQLKHTT